jgi:hypothetical protein
MADTISCPYCRCFLQMPAGYDGGEVRCPSCGRAFVGGAPTGVTAQSSPGAPEVRDKVGDASWPPSRPRRYPPDEDDLPGRAPLGRRFRPAGGLGLAVNILLGVNLFLSLVMLGSDYLQLNLANRALAGGDVADAELLSNDTRQTMLGIVHLLTYVATAIVFVIWFYRAHANLEPLGAGHLTYSPGWAAGCWFVPILNLFRPLQIAQEIWRNSDPNTVPVEDLHLARPTNSALLGFWWALWIISNVIANISVRMAWAVNSPESLRAATIAGMIAEVANIVAAILAVAVVISIDARQTARAEALRARAGFPREIGV